MNHQDIGYMLKKISDRMKFRADIQFKKLGLTLSQVNVLDYVAFRKGQTTQKEIELHLHVSHPTVVGIVSRLEEKGYLTCFQDTEDKRNKVVCLTKQSAAIGDELKESRRKNEAMLLASFSEEEVKELRRLLQMLYQNIE